MVEWNLIARPATTELWHATAVNSAVWQLPAFGRNGSADNRYRRPGCIGPVGRTERPPQSWAKTKTSRVATFCSAWNTREALKLYIRRYQVYQTGTILARCEWLPAKVLAGRVCRQAVASQARPEPSGQRSRGNTADVETDGPDSSRQLGPGSQQGRRLNSRIFRSCVPRGRCESSACILRIRVCLLFSSFWRLPPDH